MMKLAPILVVAAMLSGCGEGAPNVAGSALATSPVAIGGTPATSVTAGTEYSFQPTTSDANGGALSYTITNKPMWATCSTSSGQRSGTPSVAQESIYAGIVISVIADGAKSSLPSGGK